MVMVMALPLGYGYGCHGYGYGFMVMAWLWLKGYGLGYATLKNGFWRLISELLSLTSMFSLIAKYCIKFHVEQHQITSSICKIELIQALNVSQCSHAIVLFIQY